ncbi:hypothetical protein RUM43_007780 [Polyplax serrata]|uniref:Uncharacterized protein n=1 Tax=Polyplax serrata TaxID=468196 RepID=A0AAN8PN86_POLSC
MIRIQTNFVKYAILMPKTIKNKYNFNSTGDGNISTTPLTTPDTDTRNLRTQVSITTAQRRYERKDGPPRDFRFLPPLFSSPTFYFSVVLRQRWSKLVCQLR